MNTLVPITTDTEDSQCVHSCDDNNQCTCDKTNPEIHDTIDNASHEPFTPSTTPAFIPIDSYEYPIRIHNTNSQSTFADDLTEDSDRFPCIFATLIVALIVLVYFSYIIVYFTTLN